MHLETLDGRQLELSKFLQKFRKKFYLVGGTAIAFHIGHRHSIDFDLFTKTKINFTTIKKSIATSGFSYNTIFSAGDQIHFLINDVKLTFFEYPFDIPAEILVTDCYRIPDLLTLAAMKAFALGGRGKWKDYVDLYFIIRHHHTIGEIVDKAKALFSGVFKAA